MSITKAQLADAVASQAGLSKRDALAAVNATFDAIVTGVAGGDKVTVAGFGAFEKRTRAARPGVKPGTTEKIHVPASDYPAFKAGKNFKESVK